MSFLVLLMELLKLSLWRGIGLDFRELPPGSCLPTEPTALACPFHLHWAVRSTQLWEIWQAEL